MGALVDIDRPVVAILDESHPIVVEMQFGIYFNKLKNTHFEPLGIYLCSM